MHVSTRTRPEITARPTHAGRARRRWALVPIAAATLAFAAACTAGGASPAASTNSMSAPTATGAVVAAATTGLGETLVDGTGRTVYEFANDTGSTSTCNGECANDWPPVAAPDNLPATVAGVSGQLGSTTRSDGSKQLTVAGHPVYTFEGDTAPGQTNGNGVTLNGGRWSAVAPTGSPISAASSSPSNGY
jgi:predicted lipoprotein with Yx(FWY)xxD motif